MSYILDALKRADAQRERGAVPGLHARQVTTPAPQGASSARNRVWLAVATTLALGGLAAGLWLWQTPVSAVRLAAVEPAVASPPVAAPQPVSTPAPPAPVVAAQTPPRPQADSVAQTAEPGAAVSATPVPLPLAKPSATPATSATPVAVPLLSELSASIRREIPPLAISGVVYSENPGQRLLLVNNQVLTQGSLAAPDVNLEEIRPRSSVFSFRGTRFRVTH